MGLMDWFKSLARGSQDANAPVVEAPKDDQGAEIAGLNFKTAVDAHMKWKVRLESYINGTSTEQLQVAVVCRDDQCPLGKWIYSTGGERFGFAETFVEMKSRHADFHRCASEVLASAQAGEREKAMNLLTRGDYVRNSEKVKSLLARLFVIAAEGKAAVDSHARWKAMLRDRIASGQAANMDKATIARDDQCALAQWLDGIGRQRYAHLDEFGTLKNHHATFHQCASKAIATAQAGDAVAAMAMLDQGACEAASEDVFMALQRLFDKAGANV